MSEPIEIHFGENPEHELRFIVKGRSFPEAKNFWDANWLTLELSIRAGAFSGNVSGEVRNDQLEDFYEQLQALYQSLEGKAILAVEQCVTMTIEAKSRGQIKIYGSVNDADFNNSLNFKIYTDQSYLESPLQQIAKTIKQYPILYADK